MAQYMLSTTDNPYNPYTHWTEWYAFDTQAGYHTCSYLARICRTSTDLSDADQEDALNEAIDEILLYNLTDNYIKVYEPENDSNSNAS